MKITGLITEYNPFHNGHFYHMKEALKVTGADAVIVVMSGDYVQRGTPAVMPKHLRAKAALLAGAGAVMELPVCYSCASAEYFAGGAVSLLTKIGCDSICFGSECGNIEPLMAAADILSEEPEEFKVLLKKFLKDGKSFPLARQSALIEYMGEDADTDVLSSPNNILGIEYLKAIKQMKSPLKAYTIKRVGAAYHEKELSETYSSASAVRRALQDAALSDNNRTPLSCRHNDMETPSAPDWSDQQDLFKVIKHAIPESSQSLLIENHNLRYPIFEDDFSLILKYRLLMETKESLVSYADMTPELASRIYRSLNQFESFSQFAELLKTRELTHTRISRSLLHVLLGLRKDALETYRENGWNQYARLLGFRMDQKEILTQIQKSGEIPLLTKLTKTKDLSPLGKEMLEFDIRASELYETVAADKYRQPFHSEYQKQIVKIM